MRSSSRVLKFILLAALLALPVAAVGAQGNSAKNYAADASWSYDFPYEPTGCNHTEGHVAVTQTTTHEPPGPPQTEVVLQDFVYRVNSTNECAGEVLYYYDLHLLSGPLTLDAKDFRVNPQLRSAVLETEITVYDEECGCEIDLGIRIEWTGEGKGPAQQRDANATITILSGLQNTYIDNPVEAEDASLAIVP